MKKYGSLCLTKNSVRNAKKAAMTNQYQKTIEELSGKLAQKILESENIYDEYAFSLDDEAFSMGMAFAKHLLERLFLARSENICREYRKQGYHIVGNETVRFHSRVGDVFVSSPRFRHKKTRHYVRPMRTKFGVYGNGKSAPLQRVLSDFGSEFSYEKSSQIFERQYGQYFGRTSILSLTQLAGEEAEIFLEEKFSNALSSPSKKNVDRLFVELDGAMICTCRLMTARQAGVTGEGHHPKAKVKRIEWKDVRTGLVQREGQRKPLYVSGLFSYDAICAQMKGLAAIKGSYKSTKFIAVSDGGIGLREGLSRAFKPLVFVLDYAHLKKHMRETSEALGIEKELQKGWVKSLTNELWEEDELGRLDFYKNKVEGVIQRLRSLCYENFNARLERLISYLTKFSDAIMYGYFKQKGWPTGSGKIESAHRHVSQARLKLPGASWRVESINPMMALRIIKKNEWWSEFSEWRIQRMAM
jgi:hypothetical protein